MIIARVTTFGRRGFLFELLFSVAVPQRRIATDSLLTIKMIPITHGQTTLTLTQVALVVKWLRH